MTLPTPNEQADEELDKLLWPDMGEGISKLETVNLVSNRGEVLELPYGVFKGVIAQHTKEAVERFASEVTTEYDRRYQAMAKANGELRDTPHTLFHAIIAELAAAEQKRGGDVA